MPSTARFCEALQYAVQLHAPQRRKGSDTPYIAHLLSVTAIVLEHGGSEDEAIARYCTMRRGPGRGAERRKFAAASTRRGAIVDACSDSETMPKPPGGSGRKSICASAAGRSVHLVSAADKLHNVRALVDDYREHGESLWDRFSGGRAGTLWYYRAVADALASALPSPLAQKLEAAVAELERAAARDA
jgi:GTP pyrophosphokinase